MNEAEFADYSLTEEGKAFLASYILEEDVDSNLDLLSNTDNTRKEVVHQIEDMDERDDRKNKRSRDEETQNYPNPQNPIPSNTHNIPIYQDDDEPIEDVGSDGNRNLMEFHMDYQHNLVGERAIDNSI